MGAARTRKSALGLSLAVSTILVTVVAAFATSFAVTTQRAQALKIMAETYDKWLKPCQCYGGTLRVALPSDVTTLNWWVAGAAWDLLSLDLMYDRPLRIINGTLTWEVAESLEYSEDYMVLTMGIRKGIRFHDGVELTAEDVAFTINVLATKSWTHYHSYFTSISKAEAVDRYTVRIVFKSRDPQFILNSLTILRIMPKHIWEPKLESLGDELARYAPEPEDLIGSGPFKFVERVPAQYIKYAVNEEYWLGRPCIDEILLVPITDVSIVIRDIQRGELDTYAWGIDPAVVSTLLADPNIRIHVYTSEFFHYWGLNNLIWPLNISKFRLALSFAVNKEAIVKDIMLGYGVVGSPGVVAPFGSAALWYNPNVEKLVYYDPKKAAEILDEIGFTDRDGDGWRDGPEGGPVVIKIYSLTTGYDPIRARAAEFIKSDLEKIGVKAVVYYYEWAALWPLIREAKIMSWLLGSGWSPDIGWLNFRFRSRPEGAGNLVRYSNPEVDALLIKLLNTFDFEKRRELAWKIQEKIALDAPLINLYYRSSPNPYRADKFENWFHESVDSVFNRITALRVMLREAACPAPLTPTPTPTPTPTQAPTPPTQTPPSTPTVNTVVTGVTTPVKPTTTPARKPTTTPARPVDVDDNGGNGGGIFVAVLAMVLFITFLLLLGGSRQ